MIGSTTRQALGMVLMVAIGGVSTPKDSTRKIVGYAGVLPIPDLAAPTPVAKNDLLDARRDSRADRGRVLYANGAAPTPEVRRPAPEKRPAAHTPCAKQQLVQTRAHTLPNS